MKTIFTALLLTLISFPGHALADTGGESTGGSLAVILFLAFIGMIIVGQLIPGIRLFFSMIRGLFKKHPTEIKHAEHK